MKVTLFSNYLNHHQLPLCQALDRLTNHGFTFVATTPVPAERLSMGYHDMNKQYPFVLTTYDSAENERIAQLLALKSDVVITGSAPEIYTKMRIDQGKLTFRYSERIYKRGVWRALSPRGLCGMLRHHRKYRHAPLYMLCASAYTAFDFSLTGSYLKKTFKWGYFPEVKEQNLDELFARKHANEKIRILWAGRMIEWKHPEMALNIAGRLHQHGYDFDMLLIGNGELAQRLNEQIQSAGLGQHVHMLGAMSPEAVRSHMEQADIFLFTSDFQEGWGAVLNESMNSACAVVASHAIGSVPFLLKDGTNGLIYKNGDEADLYARVVKLIEHPELREHLGRNAYHTLAEVWNADAAAERFLALTQALLNGEDPELFADGSCSRAEILRKGWYRG